MSNWYINMLAVSNETLTATGNPEAILSEAGESIKDGNFKGLFSNIGAFFQVVWEKYGDTIIGYFWKIIAAFIVYLIGKKLIKVAVDVSERAFKKSRIEISVRKFLVRLMDVALKCLLFVTVIGILGVPTASVVALLGTLGLAVGLSLQGSLSNFAGGVLILLLKPFRVNDYIIADGLEGKVTAIDIFYTNILSPDNKKISIPNGTLANTSIQNVPHSAKRRLDLIIPVDYNADIKKVKEILYSLAVNCPKVVQQDGIDVFVSSLDDSSIGIGFRVWVSTNDYWPVKWEFLEQVVYIFREQNISIPFNQLDVMIKEIPQVPMQ